ncbi:glycosyltransferase family 4 protein [Akkermansiaceae bacterium]|nr:glycosyltransferase family 4 protein [Akkermansiaceae bacterium]
MMKHIIHINDKLSLSGGVEVYISQIQDLLRQRGWQSDWVALVKNGSRLEIQSDNQELCWQGEIRDLETTALATLASVGKVVFHVHSLSEPELLEVLFSLAPVVRTAHEPRMVCPGQGKFWAKQEQICQLPMGKHCFLHAYTKRCCNRHPKRLIKAYRNVMYEQNIASRQYARVLANSHYTENLLLDAGFSVEGVTHLPLFTRSMAAIDRTSVKSSQRILFVGRLSRTKGVHYLLRAMKMIHAALPHAELVLLGDGHDQYMFKQLTRELALEDVVNFLGWVDRETVHAEISKAAVIAFPSIYPEAFGISGIEAMVQGKPVVAFDVGGVSDWLRDGINGSLIPVKNTKAYADALIKILTDQELADQYGAAGHEIAIKEFNEDSHIKALSEIYEEVVLRRED